MVEHVVCNDETRVRFSAGPLKINSQFIFNTQKLNFCIESPTGDKTRSRKRDTYEVRDEKLSSGVENEPGCSWMIKNKNHVQ